MEIQPQKVSGEGIDFVDDSKKEKFSSREEIRIVEFNIIIRAKEINPLLKGIYNFVETFKEATEGYEGELELIIITQTHRYVIQVFPEAISLSFTDLSTKETSTLDLDYFSNIEEDSIPKIKKFLEDFYLESQKEGVLITNPEDYSRDN